MNIPSQQLDFLAFMSGEADLDELDRPECDELDEHCGEETDYFCFRILFLSPFIQSNILEFKVLFYVIFSFKMFSILRFSSKNNFI